MMASKKLLSVLAKRYRIDTAYFEHDEEWALLDAILFSPRFPAAELLRLEQMAERLATA